MEHKKRLHIRKPFRDLCFLATITSQAIWLYEYLLPALLKILCQSFQPGIIFSMQPRMSINPNIIGMAAGVFTSAAMLPQLFKIIKEKKAGDISIPMVLILLTGLSLWIWYGFMKEDWAIIGTNVFSLLVNLAMLFFGFKYKDR